MKKILLCCLWLAAFTGFSAPAPTLLPEAVSRKLVTLKPTGNGLGDQNLTCVLRNTSAHELKVQIPTGLHFKAGPEGAQDLFTIQQELIVLQPNAEKEFRLKGYCMNASKFSPRQGTAYVFLGFAPPALRTLGDSLVRYKPIADSYGQMFVWALTDHREMYDLSVEKKLLTPARNIMQYVARTANLPPVKVEAYVPGKNISYSAPLPSVNVFSKRAILAFHNPKDEVASFKIYDDKGAVKHTLFENKKVRHGLTEYTFGVNDIIRTNTAPVYYAKVISSSGKVLAQMKIDKDTEEQKISPRTDEMILTFELKTGLKKADLNVYLEDGTLVENFKRYEYLPMGHYNLTVTLMHLHPENTRFVTKLEDATGTVYAQFPEGKK